MPKPILSALCVCLVMSAGTADDPGSAVPDLTKGGELTRINERWVGPVGIYCGAWRPRHRSDDLKYVRQLLVQEVEEGSPADGILAKGDVILGADGTGAATVPLFQSADWAMIPIADAITEAEARDPAILKLLIWRPIDETVGGDDVSVKQPALDDLSLDGLDAGGDDALDDLKPDPRKKSGESDGADKAKGGKIQTVSIKLESLGRYAQTAPYDCDKSKRILRKGIQRLYETNEPDSAGLGILCLLAADDPTNPNNDKYQARAKEWAHGLEIGGNPWFSGPRLMALAEYYMKTKDQAIFPKLAEAAEHHAKGVSWFGTTGHRWCEKTPDGSDNGRIAGYGPITCSGALGFLGLSLARKAGVTSPTVEATNERQRIFFGHYAFKGGMGYGEHPYGIGGSGGDYNGKHAMTGLALGLRDDQDKKAKFFIRGAALATYSKRQYAHGGSFFGQVWHPIGAALGGVKAANLQFNEIRWHLDLKRRWDHSRIYDSSGNDYGNFATEATALLFYAMPLKQIYLTGRGQRESLKLSDAEFEEVLATKNFDPATATTRELVAVLPRYHGMLRTPAGGELARRVHETPDSPEWPALIDWLLARAADNRLSPTGRAGACYVLMSIKHRSRDLVASMKNAEIAKTMAALLKDPDPYIRFAGVRVLQKLDPASVRPHVDEILDAVVATGRPTFPLDEEDPLQWAHGEMGDLLFRRVLNKSIDGVDRTKLIAAIRSLLQTPNGSARSASTQVLAKLTKEETLEVADLLVDNIRIPPPGNAMFAGQATSNSQNALAKHMFEEALPLSAVYGPSDAIKNQIPQRYGKAALNMQAAKEFLQSVGDQILVQAIDAQGVIEGIENGVTPETLNTLKRIESIKAADTALKLPAAKTELIVDATNFGRRGENDTTYTWRKVYGTGKVSFVPNASGQSKKTTVTFTDQKPGTYRFEVAMSDTLGINVLRKTVDVTLFDHRGKLPENRPPQANSESINAVPGLPVPVTLSGTDPDGDDLGFIVTKGPAHGTLTGVGRNLVYTANFGNPHRQDPADRKDGVTEGNASVVEPPALDDFDDLTDINADEDDPLSDLDPKPKKAKATIGTTWTDSLTYKAIDGQGKTSTGTIDFKVSEQGVGVAVYEGFDYPAGAVHGLEGGTSFGFAKPWEGSRGSKSEYWVHTDPVHDAGLGPSFSYPSLPSTGGRLTGQNHTSVRRYLDGEVLSAHKLLDHGRELWFSVFVQGPGGKGRLRFGLRGGDADLGFRINGYSIDASLKGEPAGTSRNPWSRSAKLRFSETGPNMIIGRCLWGETDENPDTLEIYRVFVAPRFGPLVLKDPACVLEEVIPQDEIESVYAEFAPGTAVDEIRIGPTLSSVLLGTKPLAGSAK